MVSPGPTKGPRARLPCSHSNLWTVTVVPLRGLASGITGIIVWSWETHSCWMSSRAVPLCLRVAHSLLPNTHAHTLISPSPNPIKEVKREGGYGLRYSLTQKLIYAAHSEIQWHFNPTLVNAFFKTHKSYQLLIFLVKIKALLLSRVLKQKNRMHTSIHETLIHS